MNFIGEWFLSDLTICDDLISFYNKNKELTKPGCFSYLDEKTSQVVRKVNKNFKDSLDFTITKDLWLNPEIKNYLDELTNICKMYQDLYPTCNDVCSRWGIVEPFNIQFYEPGAGYKRLHTERGSGHSPSCFRILVFMTYLNDVTDQGETEFVNQNLKIKPEKGKTLIWPVDWTHAHRGIVSPTQEKYITTGWYSFY